MLINRRILVLVVFLWVFTLDATQFLVGHSRFPRGEACSLAALLWYVFRGKPGTDGASKEHMEEAIEYMLPAYTVIRETSGSQAGSSAPTSKSAADSPWVS